MIGKGSITLPGIAVTQPTPAQALLTAASDLYAGVVALSDKGPQVHPALVYLGSMSLECALKAYLSHAGVPIDALKKRPYGHDLDYLWEKAHEHGLPGSTSPPDWCKIMNQTHAAPYFLRYRMNTAGEAIPAYGMPAVQQVVEGLAQLLEEVRKQLLTGRARLS